MVKNSSRLPNLIPKIKTICWAWMLVSIPVTSFPFMPSLLYPEEAVVRPLMLYPLCILVFLDLLPSIWSGKKWPVSTLPLLLFFSIALISTLFPLLNPPMDLMGQSAVNRAIRGVATVVVGLTTYLVGLSCMRSEADFRGSLRWLMIGFGIAIGFGLLQYSRLTLGWPYYIHLNPIHRLISVRDMHTVRVTGLAFEPSWFADQLSVLVLPILFASITTGYKIFKGRTIWSYLLFIAGALVLIGTYSRGGVIVTAVALLIGALLEMFNQRRRILNWMLQAFQSRSRRGLLQLIVLMAGTMVILGYFIRQLSLNPYFTGLWNQIGHIDNPVAYILNIGGGPRLGLIFASYGVYLTSPFLGVGLGQSGFYILDHLPMWLFNKENEVLEMLIPGAYVFPNPKSVWIRILAETGIAGFAFFTIFVLILFIACFQLFSRKTKRSRFAGLFGIMSLVAIVLEGFSLDSFALPTWWIAFAFISAAVWITDQEGQSVDDG